MGHKVISKPYPQSRPSQRRMFYRQIKVYRSTSSSTRPLLTFEGVFIAIRSWRWKQSKIPMYFPYIYFVFPTDLPCIFCISYVSPIYILYFLRISPIHILYFLRISYVYFVFPTYFLCIFCISYVFHLISLYASFYYSDMILLWFKIQKFMSLYTFNFFSNEKPFDLVSHSVWSFVIFCCSICN